ncbi:MAG: energy transducer TonB [Saprospiraceae bacterium]|nr:energy transducer TonB [Saprospiraceae bacterium]
MQLINQPEIIGGALLVFVAIICLFSFLIRANKRGAVDYSSRTKYPGKDIFTYRPYFLELGLFISLTCVYLLSGWTTTQNNVLVMNDPDGPFETMDLEIVRTEHLKGPAIKTAPVERPHETLIISEILETEEPLFIDQTIVEPEYSIGSEKMTTHLPPAPPMPKNMEADIPVLFSEHMPRFPGCENHNLSDAELKNCSDKKLLHFLYRHLKYPVLARENSIDGTCVIRFLVTKEGTVQRASVIRDIGGGCGEEALRVVNLMQEMADKWTPGRQNGQPVTVQFNLPVQFRLER